MSLFTKEQWPQIAEWISEMEAKGYNLHHPSWQQAFEDRFAAETIRRIEQNIALRDQLRADRCPAIIYELSGRQCGSQFPCFDHGPSVNGQKIAAQIT